MPNRLAIWITTGIITATRGVLFITAEAAATKVNSSPIVSLGRAPTWASAIWITISTAPVRTNPPINRNISTIVQGAVFDSTSTALPSGKIPKASITAAPPIAVTSTG